MNLAHVSPPNISFSSKENDRPNLYPRQRTVSASPSTAFSAYKHQNGDADTNKRKIGEVDKDRRRVDAKRAARLARKAELARQSRKKKKAYVQQLELRVKQLESFCKANTTLPPPTSNLIINNNSDSPPSPRNDGQPPPLDNPNHSQKRPRDDVSTADDSQMADTPQQSSPPFHLHSDSQSPLKRRRISIPKMANCSSQNGDSKGFTFVCPTPDGEFVPRITPGGEFSSGISGSLVQHDGYLEFIRNCQDAYRNLVRSRGSVKGENSGPVHNRECMSCKDQIGALELDLMKERNTRRTLENVVEQLRYESDMLKKDFFSMQKRLKVEPNNYDYSRT